MFNSGVAECAVDSLLMRATPGPISASRLKSGVPPAAAAAEMDSIGVSLKQQYGNGENAIGVAKNASSFASLLSLGGVHV